MEDNKENVVENTTENTETQTAEQKVEKTFTQAEFNEALKKELARKTKNMPSADELKLFNSWRESQKTEQDKYNDLEKNYNSMVKENDYLKAQIKLNSSNVKKEFSKFVTSEVMSMVSDNMDFETALADFKKNNPQYFGEVVVKKTQTAPTLGGGTAPKTTNSIMNDLLRNRGK